MQRMSYICILNFQNQQSMQNQNYRSLPISERFQPIEVELENGKQSKEVDFKLFVLLILIVFLGLLINKHQEQLENQSQSAIMTSTPQGSPLLNTGNPPEKTQDDMSSQMEENEESQCTKKQLYSQDKKLQQSEANLPVQKVTSLQQNSLIPKQKPVKSIRQIPSVENQSKQKQESGQNSKEKNSELPQPQNNTNANKHRKQMRKYIQFYFWFPFFIFALIIYTCYQKQYSSSSMFIEVQKSTALGSSNIPQDCAICITEMRQQDLLAVLPCSSKHLFHSECIKQWLAVKKTCPICRCDVRVAIQGRG